MQLEHIQDDLLQRYYDGELTGKRSERVRNHLQECQLCQKRQQSLARLHGLFQLNAEQIARDVDFDLLYRRVASQIERQQPAGLIEKLQAWWDGIPLWRPQVWAPATAVAFAAIAIVVLNARWREQGSLESTRGRKQPRSLVAEAPASAAGSEVVRVDFGDKPGTVFEVALAEGVTTAVVWINDETDNSEIP
jgi:anti-sigma factor RsiW